VCFLKTFWYSYQIEASEGENVLNPFYQIVNNDILVAAFLSWFIAQLLKFLFFVAKYKKIDITRLVGSGGMPSSHSSLMMGLSTSIGLKIGFDSLEFALALCMALVVMYDASGVRRAVGIQAKILNQMLKDMKEMKHIEKNLKELVGHTPIEVFVGAFLGIIIANIII
jgi:hypothetical protein